VYLCGKREDRPYLNERVFEAEDIEVVAQNYYREFPEGINAVMSWLYFASVNPHQWTERCFSGEMFKTRIGSRPTLVKIDTENSALPRNTLD